MGLTPGGRPPNPTSLAGVVPKLPPHPDPELAGGIGAASAWPFARLPLGKRVRW